MPSFGNTLRPDNDITEGIEVKPLKHFIFTGVVPIYKLYTSSPGHPLFTLQRKPYIEFKV